jgi:hypothetical protein
VLFKLGNDLELASEMMGMTPTKRAIAMDKLATTKVERQQSKAPPPVEPIGGKGPVTTPRATTTLMRSGIARKPSASASLLRPAARSGDTSNLDTPWFAKTTASGPGKLRLPGVRLSGPARDRVRA